MDGSRYIGQRVGGKLAARAGAAHTQAVAAKSADLKKAADCCNQAKILISNFQVPSLHSSEANMKYSASELFVEISLDDDPHAFTKSEEGHLAQQANYVFQLLAQAKSLGDKRADYLIVEMELVYTIISKDPGPKTGVCGTLKQCAQAHLNLYQLAHWQQRIAELCALHDDRAVAVEVRCWAMLTHAKVLLHLHQKHPPLKSYFSLFKKQDYFSKAKVLCLGLPDKLGLQYDNTAGAEILQAVYEVSVLHDVAATFLASHQVNVEFPASAASEQVAGVAASMQHTW